MKLFKLYLLLFCLASSQHLFSQSKKVSNFQAKQLGFKCDNTKGDDLVIVNFLVSIDYEKTKIILNREIKEEYFIKKIVGDKKDTESITTIYLCTNLKDLKDYEILVVATISKVFFQIQAKDSNCYDVVICGYL
jgi:TFIIF-interacting CTD phosphatase-like protein